MNGTLPIIFLTKDRTGCACACADAMLSRLSVSGYTLRHIVCDDGSTPGHLEAVLGVYRRHGVEPSVHVSTRERHGLGAIMNMGLEDAFLDPSVDKCLRMEDDWLLKRPLDIGPLVGQMDSLKIGSLRLGMMFREESELPPFNKCLLRVRSLKKQTFTYNNQIAVVTRGMYEMLGRYPENAAPPVVEKHAANKYNKITDYGHNPPYVAWPAGWKTKTYYDEKLPFAHIGASISGHDKLYRIPLKYMGYNDQKLSERLRSDALSATTASTTA